MLALATANLLELPLSLLKVPKFVQELILEDDPCHFFGVLPFATV